MKYRVLLTLAALACTARATVVTIRITGTVSFGSDLSGVFLGSGCTQNTPCDLTGQSFALVYTFDDTLGEQSFASNISFIQQTPTSNPGTALLTINNNSFEFAAPGREVLTSTAQSDVPPGREDEYSVAVSDLGAAVGGHLYPAEGRSFGNGADWRTSFTYLGPFASGDALVANINEASQSARAGNIYLVPNILQVDGISCPMDSGAEGRVPDSVAATDCTCVNDSDQLARDRVTRPDVTSSDDDIQDSPPLPRRPVPPRYKCPVLQIATLSIPSATSGQPYNTTFSATGGQGEIRWTETIGNGGLPVGFTLSPAGVLASNGMPVTAAGNYVVSISATDSTGQKASKEFPLTILSPTCAEVVKASVTLTVCDLRSTQPCYPPEMRATFRPQPPAAHISMSAAAQICGFKDFNWQQWVTNLPAPSPFFDISNPFVPLVAPPAFPDPPKGGYSYDPLSALAYPFYFDPDILKIAESSGTSLSFFDPPSDNCLPGGSGSKCGGATAKVGSFMGFTTALVGVLPNGSPSSTLYSWTWVSTATGEQSGGEVYVTSR